MKTFISKYLAASVVVFALGCIGPDSRSQDDPIAQKTKNHSTDEAGEPVRTLRAKRSEGYTVHPSTQLSVTSEKFFCEGYQVETKIHKRVENQQLFSQDLSLELNGEKIDLTSLAKGKANLTAYENVDISFACVDDIIRILVYGKTVDEEQNLGPDIQVLDLIYDRTSRRFREKRD